MKHILRLVILLICSSSVVKAQPFKNGWINYAKTYYKFRVGPFGFDVVNAPIRKGVVRITQPVLASAGLGNVPAEQFQMWRNGTEQAIYLSKSTGILAATDFIEFYGEIADGAIDKELYPQTNHQINASWNLSTDSATYFLTKNTGANLRLVNAPNNASGSTLPTEKNFTYTTGRYYRSAINNGFGIIDSKILYLSSYERGEGFTSRAVKPNNCGCSTREMPQIFSSLMADTINTTCSVAMTMVGNAQNERDVKILLNGDSIANVKMNFFSTAFPLINTLSAARIVNDQVTIITRDSSAEPNDEIRVGQIEFTYKRKFNFNNASIFEFTIDPSPVGRLIKIVNFNGGVALPVLYDLTNRKRYTALNTATDTLRFLTGPSAQSYQLVLVRGDGSTAQNIPVLHATVFKNFAQVANQSNYIIITNPLLLGTGPEDNYAEQYRAYRSSVAGGSFNAKIYDITQLEDQFAYGIKSHPLAVKDFFRYARSNFQSPVSNVFIIGKAVSYASYRMTGQNPFVDKINLVPTYGFPGSDNLLASEGFADISAVPIGRLSAVSPQEIGIYLDKVKAYEAQQANNADSIERKAWTKQVLQLTGANDVFLGGILDTMMRNYKAVIADTSFGANVFEYSKTANPDGFADAVVNFASVYNSGSALLTYFGHSSAQTIDFSLDNPNNYNNPGRYPMFIVNGCLAGNIFDYDANRLANVISLSEKFMLAPQRGSIAYLSGSSYGVVNYLDIFTQEMYRSIARTKYGQSLGVIMQEAFTNALNYIGSFDFYGRMHAQQYTLHGDPALKLNTYTQPDYAVQANNISLIKPVVSISDDFAEVNVRLYNLGKAVKDSVRFTLYRFENGDSIIVFRRRFVYIPAVDSVMIKIPILPNQDAGTTNYLAVIDDNNLIAERSETNNSANFSITIRPIELKPVYPYNYAIINSKSIRLAASTALINDTVSRRYVVEIDSTTLFNSPEKRRYSTISRGGLVLFRDINLPADNQVYFWRVSPDVPDNNKNWNVFSFTYRSTGAAGFEQSSFYQHTNSTFDGIKADSASRLFSMSDKLNNLYLLNSIFPTSGIEDIDFSISVNGSLAGVSACVGSSIIYHVMDEKSFRVFENTTNPFGAAPPCGPNRSRNFEFSTQTSTSRKNAMDFMDQHIPNGAYVAVRKVYDQGNKDWAPTIWAADTAIYGSRNSLYHRFKDQGLSIDSFTFPRTFIFVYKKNDQGNFTPVSIFSGGLFDRISYSGNLQAKDTSGTITSPLLGPATNWSQMNWSGADLSANNRSSVHIYGNNGQDKDSLFFTIPKNQLSQNITTINAAQWPYIKLQLCSSDTITVQPHQLQYWQVTGNAVPEGSLAPNFGMKIPRQLNFNQPVRTQYDTLKGFIAFANVSQTAFSPIKVNIQLIDSLGRVFNFNQPRTRALGPRDTLNIQFNIDLSALPTGRYNFRLDVNPGKDQPEQYDFNNTLYQYIKINRTSPIVQVNVSQQQIQQSVRLLPNPVYTDAYIYGLAPDTKAVFNLVNTLGQLVYERIIVGNEAVHLSAIPKGFYVATLTTDTATYKWKIQKM